MTDEETETIGIIYPIMQNNFDLLLERKNPVYVKYITHVKSKHPTRLNPGHFLLLYLSRKDKEIIGYARIENIRFLKPNEIKQHYVNRIQMDKEEFNGYILDRNEKQLICLELEKIIKKQIPVKVDNPITMAGKYVDTIELKSLLGEDFID